MQQNRTEFTLIFILSTAIVTVNQVDVHCSHHFRSHLRIARPSQLFLSGRSRHDDLDNQVQQNSVVR